MTAIQYISQLPSAAAWGGTDLFPVTQNSTGPSTGTTRKLTVAQLFTSPTFTGTTTVGSNLADYVTITGAANTGVVDTASPVIQAAGTATEIDVKVLGKGNGRLNTTRLYVGAPGDRPGADANQFVNMKLRPNAYTTTCSGAFRVGSDHAGTVTSGQAFFNSIAIDSDTVDPTTGGGPQGANGLYVGHTVSAGAKGGRTGLAAFLNVSGAITGGVGNYQVAVGATAAAAANAGGSAGFGNGRGNLFGANPIAILSSGATYWNSLVGAETTIGAQAGSSVYYKNGFQIALGFDDAVSGAGGFDAGLLFAAQISGVSPGWDIGITFGHDLGWWPIKSTGKIIGTVPANGGLGPTYAAAWGVDFSAVTFSGGFLKSTGFEVDGIGRTTAPAFILTSGGPTITTGAGVPATTTPKGSIYFRTGGAVGSTLYVSQGGGTWNAVAGV